MGAAAPVRQPVRHAGDARLRRARRLAGGHADRLGLRRRDLGRGRRRALPRRRRRLLGGDRRARPAHPLRPLPLRGAVALRARLHRHRRHHDPVVRAGALGHPHASRHLACRLRHLRGADVRRLPRPSRRHHRAVGRAGADGLHLCGGVRDRDAARRRAGARPPLEPAGDPRRRGGPDRHRSLAAAPHHPVRGRRGGAVRGAGLGGGRQARPRGGRVRAVLRLLSGRDHPLRPPVDPLGAG